MTESVLEIRDVSKHFGHQKALDHVNLNVKRGEIYGLVGENGAGKTTLMRLITTLSPLDQGEIVLLGEKAGHYKMALSRIGAMIESPAAFSKLTVWQNLRITAIQHGLADKQQVQKTIELVGLKEKRNTKAKNLSLGQRQRLGLAIALVMRPDFLILDEPINGLDPMGIIAIRKLLRQLNKEQDTTILISSHILTELYQVATTFGFLYQGRLIQTLANAQLDTASQTGLLLTVSDVKQATQVFDENQIKPFQVLDDQRVMIYDPDTKAGALNQLLVANQVEVLGMTKQESSLEQYYTQLIQKQEVPHA